MQRRDQYLGEDGYYYTPRDLAIKWVVITSLMVGFLLFMGLAYWHAQRRMRSGMPPLGYHRWLAPRSQRAQFDPELQNRFAFYQVNSDNMNSQAPPPYNPDLVPPPKYQPPAGSTTKLDPARDPSYEAPATPPAGGPSFGLHTNSVPTTEPPPAPQPPAAVHPRGLLNPFRR